MILEGILTAVVLLLVLLFLGVPLATIITWALIALLVILALMIVVYVLFFFATGISLLFFRRVRGQFIRFDDTNRYERAVYLAEDTEYVCLFPAENVARRRIYQTEHPQGYTLLIPRSRKHQIAYDRHSLTIIAIGLISSGALTAVVVFGVLRFFRLI